MREIYTKHSFITNNIIITINKTISLLIILRTTFTLLKSIVPQKFQKADQAFGSIPGSIYSKSVQKIPKSKTIKKKKRWEFCEFFVIFCCLIDLVSCFRSRDSLVLIRVSQLWSRQNLHRLSFSSKSL